MEPIGPRTSHAELLEVRTLNPELGTLNQKLRIQYETINIGRSSGRRVLLHSSSPTSGDFQTRQSKERGHDADDQTRIRRSKRGSTSLRHRRQRQADNVCSWLPGILVRVEEPAGRIWWRLSSC